MKLEVPQRNAAIFSLGRHHLLERAPRGRALEVVDDIMGLNAQGALNVQLSLWNRVRDLDTDFIPRALNLERSLVKTWLMRDTVHIVRSNRLQLYRRALKESLLREWSRWTVKTGAKQSASSWEPLYPRILEILDGDPLTLNDMLHALGWGKEEGVMLGRLVREMSLRGLICHAKASGPWYHNTEYTFARTDRWLPGVHDYIVSDEEALSTLVLGYLKAYGPASIRDFAYWSGMRAGDAKRGFDAASESISEVAICGQRRTLFISKEDGGELIRAAAERAPARLLPKFDPLIMGYMEKDRFIEPRFRKEVCLPRGEIAATMMMDGQVRGTWTMTKVKNLWRLEVTPFDKPSEQAIREVEVEADALMKFTGFDIELRWNTRNLVD